MVTHAAPGLRHELGPFDGIAVVVGTIIGSGIFLIPSFVAVQLHALGAVLLVWTVGGLLTLCGALSLGELRAMYPGAGGLCAYLREAYGPWCAFLYAWALLFMIHSGSIAGLAVAFELFLRQIVPLTRPEEKLASVGLILELTVINCVGIRFGKLAQNLFAITKVTGLVAIILLLAIVGTRPLHLFHSSGAGHPTHVSIAAFSTAMVAVLWAYEGWHAISFVAGEMKRPRLDLPRSLLCGTIIVITIFILANLGYYHVLSGTEIETSNAVAAYATGKVWGFS